LADVVATFAGEGRGDDDELDDYLVGMPDEWEDLPASLFGNAGDWTDARADGGEADEDEGNDTSKDGSEGDEQAPADGEGSSVYLWGRRASGFAFAQGAPLSAAIYDKALEARRSGKRWMEALHRAG